MKKDQINSLLIWSFFGFWFTFVLIVYTLSLPFIMIKELITRTPKST